MRKVALITLLSLVLAPVAFGGEEEEMAVFHDKGYLVSESEDGKTKYWVDGRIMLDYGDISSDSGEALGVASGWETRRARLAVKTIFNGEWAGEFDMDIADNEVEIKDFWMSYIGFDNTIVKIGNHKVPTSQEELTSSRHLTFMERSLMNTFNVGRRIGVSYNRWGEKYLVMGGYFGEEPAAGEDEGEDEAMGFGLRAAFAPINTDDNVLHFGFSYNDFEPDAGSDDEVRFRTRELHLMPRFPNTGNVDMVSDYQILGVELAGQMGAWSFQSEYMKADLTRMAGAPDASYDGYYAFVSWIPFGGQRTYSMDSGEWGAVNPKGKRGALELALRASNVNLNDFDAGVEGGEADNITLGLNWYANDHVRMMFNYIKQDNDEFADGDGDFLPDDDLDIIAVRFQLTF
ncbi:MAG: hypothetical protein IFK94_07995 [Acidobacteria bacterium]|uniref:Porin n=1 Tax=Candidatus Polarisedimenticola svalbardensis TaxID=2886004 RepID=A0A8J6Y8B2_9BACT|nr:hypothetical protein [Candidatus Polarisedimenticola svalbardensis]